MSLSSSRFDDDSGQAEKIEKSKVDLAGFGHAVTGRRPSPLEQPGVVGYEIIDRLGSGGMGVVWRARQLAENRVVALKMMIAGENATDLEIQRWHVEVEAVGRIRHPNVARLLDVGETEGRPWFGMEYCSGGDLGRFFNRTPQPPMLAAQIVETLARAISHSHSVGIVHRDLKPSNILLADRVFHRGRPSDHEKPTSVNAPGRPGNRQFSPEILRITDFGLARRLDAETLTRPDAVLGTPQYMSPEQAAGQNRLIGPATDIWSLGVVLYEALTASLPFVGTSGIEVLFRIRDHEPIPPSMKVDCPADLEAICMKCLSRKIGDRYATAEDLAADLLAYRENRPVSAPRVRNRALRRAGVRRWSFGASAAAAGVAALLTASAVSVRWATRAEDAARQADLAHLETQQHADRASDRLKRADKDLAEAKCVLEPGAAERTKRTRTLISVADTAPVAQSAAARDLLSLVDPDQRNFEWGLLWDRVNGNDRKYTLSDGWIRTVAIHPDGRRLFAAGEKGTVWVLDPDTGRELLAYKGHGGTAIDALVLSPDGEKVASASRDGTVRIWDSRSGLDEIQLTIRGRSEVVTCVRYSRDGGRLWTCGIDGSVRMWETGTGELLGEWPTGGGKVIGLIIDDREELLACGDTTGKIYVREAFTGKKVVDIQAHSGHVHCLAFAPSGTLISAGSDNVLRYQNPRTGSEVLKTGCTNGSCWLTVHAASKRLFVGGIDGSLTVRDLATAEELLMLKAHTGSIGEIAVSPDGAWVIACSHNGSVRAWKGK